MSTVGGKRPAGDRQIRVTVTNPQDEPVEAADVCIVSDGAEDDFALAGNGRTTADGVTTIAVMRGEARLVVSATADGFLAGRAEIQPTENAVTVRLATGEARRLQLRWPGGDPAVGVVVGAHGSGYDTRAFAARPVFRTLLGVGFQKAVTNENGIAVLTGLGRGPWHIWLRDGWVFDPPDRLTQRQFMIDGPAWPRELVRTVAQRRYAVFAAKYKGTDTPVSCFPKSFSIGSAGDPWGGGGFEQASRGLGRFAFPVLMRDGRSHVTMRIDFFNSGRVVEASVPLVSRCAVGQRYPRIDIEDNRRRGRISIPQAVRPGAAKLKLGVTSLAAEGMRGFNLIADRRKDRFVASLPAGRYRRAVHNDNAAPARWESGFFEVREGETTKLDLRRKPTPHMVLQVRIRDVHGKRVRNCDVRILQMGRHLRWRNDPADATWPVEALLFQQALFASGVHAADIYVAVTRPGRGQHVVKTSVSRETREGGIDVQLPD